MKDKINTTIRRHDLIWNKFKKDNTHQYGPWKIKADVDEVMLMTASKDVYLDNLSGMYGGDQGAPYRAYVSNNPQGYNSFMNSFNRKIILDHFPNMTEEDIVNYLWSMGQVGCGYVAIANYIFESYIGNEEQFAKDFGFPMYYEDENERIPNVNILFVYLYCEVYSKGLTEHAESVQPSFWDKLFNNDNYFPGDLEHNKGTNQESRSNILDYFKSRYGVDISYLVLKPEREYPYENYGTIGEFMEASPDEPTLYQLKNEELEHRKKIRTIIEQGDYVQISADDFTLYRVDANNNRIPTEAGKKFVDAPHAMTIVGINDNGDYIVSSWGKKYALDPDSLNISYRYAQVKIRGVHPPKFW